MFSLAAINYRDILTSHGGPIERVSTGTIDVLGRLEPQAIAYLKPGLIRGKSSLNVYGNGDGTGSNRSPQVARHMAISEALERWAFYETAQSDEAEKYGFDLDNSTNGMAAFPGFFKVQARKRAHLEALERWALISWWSGHMRASMVGDAMFGVTALRLEHSAKFGEVAVLFRRSAAGHVSYGYSAGSTFATAVARAAVELARNEFVVSYYKLRSVAQDVPNCFERRCLYFAGEEGHAEFLRRAFDRKPHRETEWSVKFDGEIAGAWSKYATVWRVVPEMPSREYLDPKNPFFFW
jgi:ribosomal protein S12 methylthiotransferase accessory factor YcaO